MPALLDYASPLVPGQILTMYITRAVKKLPYVYYVNYVVKKLHGKKLHGVWAHSNYIRTSFRVETPPLASRSTAK
jgi:hypothetical protein